MIILAIDPGNTQSAYVLYSSEARIVLAHAKLPNDELLAALRARHFQDAGVLAIEHTALGGMIAGQEVFDTCMWAGRFIEAWSSSGAPFELVKRMRVKMAICGDSRAKDANIRAALIDRFGPGKEKAIGRKKAQGPLFGVANDQWSALAIAVTYAETRSVVMTGFYGGRLVEARTEEAKGGAEVKFRVTMKDPDTLYDAVREAVELQLAGTADLDSDERKWVQEAREDEVRDKCSRWFRYGEYLTVEIDTKAMTCVVVESK